MIYIYTYKKTKLHNPNKSHIPDYSYKIVIFSRSGSEINVLLNLYVKDSFYSK